MWSLISDKLGVENEETNNLNLANKVFNRQNVLILGGLNSRISLYNVCPGKPHFPYIKWGFPGYFLHRLVNVMF